MAATPDDERAADDRARTRSSRLVGALYTMMGALAIGVGSGFAIDRHFGTSPAWTVGLSMLGLVVGFYQLIREALR